MNTTNWVYVAVTNSCGFGTGCSFQVGIYHPPMGELSISNHLGLTITLRWSSGGDLVYADDVRGPWNLVTGPPAPVSGYTVPVSVAHRFYRLLCHMP